MDWPTWGLTNSDSHTWTAADCNDFGCNPTQSPGVTVTIANVDPVVTAPVNGAFTSTAVTLDATSPGGGLAFFVDTVQVGFDATTPYSFTVAGPLTAGVHSMLVQECDASGTVCSGPTAGANFTVKVLHPSVTAVSPNPFSPNRDGRNDSTSFRISLPDTENVSYAIRNKAGALVKSFHPPGVLHAGNHTYVWGGASNASTVVGSGAYTIVVSTSALQSGVKLFGTASATVTVDDISPTMSNATGNGSTFYPVVDKYLDTFAPKVTVNEPGTLWLFVYNWSGRVVREIMQPHASPGTFSFSWNGYNSGGAFVVAGAYHYKFLAQDRAGNRRSSVAYLVRDSHQRLVNKSATLSHNGDAGSIGTTDTSCTQYSYGLSLFAHGVWLDNVCDQGVVGLQVVFADYSFTIPGAIKYENIRVRSYGNTISAPELVASIIYNFTTRKWEPIAAVLLTRNVTNGWSTYGTVPALNRVSSRHEVRISIGVPNSVIPEDYDIGIAEITVAYAVLQ